MILETIIKEMAQSVAGLGFISKSGGLLQEVNTTAGEKDAIMTWAQVAPFTAGKMVDVYPDKTERGISFFKVGPTRIVRQDTHLTQRENEIVFTCWLNGDRLKEQTETSAEEMIVRALRLYKIQIKQGSPIRLVEIEYLGDNTGESINRWGWENKMLQYNLAPHKLFQHRFRILYTVANGCVTQTVDVLNPAC